MQAAVNAHLIKMIMIFSREGHSGGSAGWAAAALNRLLKFKPLAPLFGTDDEWVEVGETEAGVPIFQNSRYGCVFKEGKDGQAYDIETRVYDDGSALFQRGGDRQPITFPYSPPAQPEVVKVNALGHRTFQVDYVYADEEWECTYPWGDRSELVEDRPEPFVPYKVKSLVQGPDLWVISIPIAYDIAEDDFEDFEDKFFVSEQEAKDALQEAKDRLKEAASTVTVSGAPETPETGDRPSETDPNGE